MPTHHTWRHSAQPPAPVYQQATALASSHHEPAGGVLVQPHLHCFEVSSAYPLPQILHRNRPAPGLLLRLAVSSLGFHVCPALCYDAYPRLALPISHGLRLSLTGCPRPFRAPRPGHKPSCPVVSLASTAPVVTDEAHLVHTAVALPSQAWSFRGDRFLFDERAWLRDLRFRAIYGERPSDSQERRGGGRLGREPSGTHPSTPGDRGPLHLQVSPDPPRKLTSGSGGRVHVYFPPYVATPALHHVAACALVARAIPPKSMPPRPPRRTDCGCQIELSDLPVTIALGARCPEKLPDSKQAAHAHDQPVTHVLLL